MHASPPKSKKMTGAKGSGTASTAQAGIQKDIHGSQVTNWSAAELFVMREISKVIGKSLDPAYAIRHMFHLLSEFLGLNRGRLLLADPGGKSLSIRYSYGLTQSEVKRGVFQAGEGICGKVYQSGQATIVQDIDADPNYLARTVKRTDLPKGTISMFVFPILVNGVVQGVMAVNRFRGLHRPLTEDIQVLQLVVAQITQLLRIELLVQQQIEQRTAELVVENRVLKHALETHAQTNGIIGESLASRAALRQITQVANTVATVLLLGESGTGKELFARALHTASDRRDAPFIKVNCGAIPDDLFESELFGHDKGAFTGAVASKPGRFEDAMGGTLFLDEIGDLPLQLQVKLLRALQEQKIQRVGGRKEISVDVRIVAATNRDLHQLVAEGRFRLDLFYRLNVVPIRLPALRERPEDIPALTRHFLSQANQAFQRNASLTSEGLDLLMKFPWHGNIRQLQNIVERLVLLAEKPTIESTEVGNMLTIENASNAQFNPPKNEVATVRHPQSQQLGSSHHDISGALEECGGNKSRAAQFLGLTLSQFNYRLKKLNPV